MPQMLKIHSLEPGLNCIMLPIHLKTMDTIEEALSEAMVDTGAMDNFINQDFVRNTKLPTRKLSQPILVYNVNGTPNETGSIHKVVDMIMTYSGHLEQIRTVKMTRCLPHCCIGCKAKWKTERDTKKRETQQINVCCAGLFPAFIEDTKDELKDGQFEVPLEEEDFETPLDEDNELLEEGDRIWATGLFPEAEQIRATTLISQRLAEGFRQNSTSLIKTLFEMPSCRLVSCHRKSWSITSMGP